MNSSKQHWRVRRSRGDSGLSRPPAPRAAMRGRPNVTETVWLADGRQISVEVSGNPSGRPVFLLHGTPGSRLAPRPRGMVLYRLGARLITVDRPGYGHSDRLPGRRGAERANDRAGPAEGPEWGGERSAGNVET